MPKRKIKEGKPPRRMSKKQMLIPPIAMGAATLVALVIIPTFAPPPNPTQVCLKATNVESFQLYPRIDVIVNGMHVLLPSDVGKQLKDGKDCVRPIRTDEVGNIVHVEYIRPVRLTLGNFMEVYNVTNTIKVVDNSTGKNEERILNLSDYNIEYSYYSEAGEFTKVASPYDTPPFPQDNKMIARIQLTTKTSGQ